MRILVTTNKSISHFAPMLPFAKGLKERGHEVRVAALPDLAEDIAKHGFGHLVLNGPSDAQRDALNKRAKRVPREEVGKYFMSNFFMTLLARNFLPGLLSALETWRPNLILRETTEFSGLIAAQKLGIRHARFEIVNGESEESIATNYVREMDALRSFVSLDPAGSGYLGKEPSFSAHPKVLDDTLRVNSQEPFRFRMFEPANVRTNDTRPEWLPAGERPLIYITFGTIAADVDSAKHVYKTSIDAVAGLPVTALLTTGKNAPDDLVRDVPDNVIVREFVPQAEVFQHAKIMVCHGGSGTVLGGLRSGIPMIVVPLFADQTDNARCLASAGLCVRLSDDDIQSLPAVIENVMHNAEMQRRARKAADAFAKLPTVNDALDILVGG